jgi:hypothetical protein
MTDESRKQWEEINAFLNPKPTEAQVPLPSAAPRAAMSLEQQETLFSNWQEHILSKSPPTWSAEERNAIRFASSRVLRGLAY